MPDRAAAFEAVHSAFRPKVVRYLRRLVDPAEAEDLAQIVMLKVGDGLPGFRGESQLSTWIYRIATNAALDRLRRHDGVLAARGTKPIEVDWRQGGSADRLDAELGTCAPSVETLAIRQEMNDCIREFIARLPGSYRIVIVLSELEGFSNGEISAILGVSLDTVKIRLHRARARLRQDLAGGCTFYRDADRDELACDRKPTQ